MNVGRTSESYEVWGNAMGDWQKERVHSSGWNVGVQVSDFISWTWLDSGVDRRLRLHLGNGAYCQFSQQIHTKDHGPCILHFEISMLRVTGMDRAASVLKWDRAWAAETDRSPFFFARTLLYCGWTSLDTEL